jgi:hypothetical protein
MIATAHRPTTAHRRPQSRELGIFPASIVILVASVMLSLSMALAITAAARQPGTDQAAPAPAPVTQPSVAPPGLDL